MKKIIKDGTLNFSTVCEVCGCKFEYGVEDIDDLEVDCPCCGYPCTHATFGDDEELK